MSPAPVAPLSTCRAGMQCLDRRRTSASAADRANAGPLHFPSNTLLCGLRVAVIAVTPAAGRGERVIGRNLDQDDPDAVGSSIHISVRPQGSAAGSLTIGTPAAASRTCPA
jgi:hypothetical protein